MENGVIKLRFIESSNPTNPPKDDNLKIKNRYNKQLRPMDWMGWEKVGYMDESSQFHEHKIVAID